VIAPARLGARVAAVRVMSKPSKIETEATKQPTSLDDCAAALEELDKLMLAQIQGGVRSPGGAPAIARAMAYHY
jgi:hypothetical protein